jgi:hypothetical protein
MRLRNVVLDPHFEMRHQFGVDLAVNAGAAKEISNPA